MKTPLLIIGSGIAGAMAAIEAADHGVPVVVIRRGFAATAMSGSVIELNTVARWGRQVLGRDDSPAWALPLVDRFMAIMAESGVAYAGDPERWLTLANALGTIRKAQYAPLSMAGGDLALLDGAHLLVIGISGYPDFRADFISQSLQHLAGAGLAQARFTTVAREVALPEIRHEANISSFDIAQVLDASVACTSFAERVASAVIKTGATHIAFPPLLGWQNPAGVLAIVEAVTGRPCFELVPAPPSVPGMRLQMALDRAMAERGVIPTHGMVTDFTASGGRILSVRSRDKDQLTEWEPDEVILASGKFIAGGVERAERLRETIFDLPLFIDGSWVADEGMAGFVNESFFARQRIFAAGVMVDRALRPVTSGGVPVYENLRAAGAIMEGFEMSYRGGGLGLALVSGGLCGAAVAGREVAE